MRVCVPKFEMVRVLRQCGSSWLGGSTIRSQQKLLGNKPRASTGLGLQVCPSSALALGCDAGTFCCASRFEMGLKVTSGHLASLCHKPSTMANSSKLQSGICVVIVRLPPYCSLTEGGVLNWHQLLGFGSRARAGIEAPGRQL